MLDSRIWMEPFKNTVEGRPFPASAEIENGSIFLRFDRPIKKGTKPNPDLIQKLLLSNIHLSQHIRGMIANWLTQNEKSAFFFKQFKRRKSGRYPAWNESNTDIGLFIEGKIENGQKFESAVAEACSKFHRGRTTVTNAYKMTKNARKLAEETAH